MLKKISLLIAIVLPFTAGAAVNLKKVNIVDGSSIELLFDGKVDPSQVKTEFVRDNIQLSLLNTSVYPAKVSMVSGSELTKVFAYQYSPQLVRARFTVKGDASEYANRLQVKISGKIVTVRIAPATAAVTAKADQVPTSASSTLKTVSTATEVVAAESEKKALLERITAGEKSEKKIDKTFEKRMEKTKDLGTGKSLPSPMRSIGVMVFVLGLFGLFVMFLKRLKGQGKSAKSAKGGLGGFLNKLSGGNGPGKPMIEVVATHHLAPKRSIVVVRVQERMFVLGMTNDAMNLISEFKANDEGEADENIGLGDFAASLKKFETADANAAPTAKLSPKANLGDIAAAALGLAKPKPVSAPRANAAASAYMNTQTAKETPGTGPSFSPALAAALREPSVKPSIRAQIKDRVQGMKQL